MLVRQARYFLDKGFRFQQHDCNEYYNVLMMSMNRSSIAISILNVNYHCIINGISKSEAKNLMQNIDLSEKSGTL